MGVTRFPNGLSYSRGGAMPQSVPDFQGLGVPPNIQLADDFVESPGFVQGNASDLVMQANYARWSLFYGGAAGGTDFVGSLLQPNGLMRLSLSATISQSAVAGMPVCFALADGVPLTLQMRLRLNIPTSHVCNVGLSFVAASLYAGQTGPIENSDITGDSVLMRHTGGGNTAYHLQTDGGNLANGNTAVDMPVDDTWFILTLYTDGEGNYRGYIDDLEAFNIDYDNSGWTDNGYVGPFFQINGPSATPAAAHVDCDWVIAAQDRI